MNIKPIKSIALFIFFIFTFFTLGCGGTSSPKTLSQSYTDAYDDFSTGKIKGKVTKAIKGIKGIFKHKNKDKIEGEEEEKGKKEENENDGESKISKTKKYLKQLKRKFIKRRDSSVGNDKKNLNKKKEDKKERHNSFKAKNIPEE